MSLDRHQSSPHTGWQRLPHDLSGTVRVGLTGEARSAGEVIQTQAPQRGAVTNRKVHSMTDNEIATNFQGAPEVPMNTHDELLLWHALHRLEVAYWYDVD